MNVPARTRRSASTRPPIVISRSDRAILERVAVEGLLHAPRVAGALLDEIQRAQVIGDDEVGADVVRIGSRVTFREEPSAELRTARLVAAGQDRRGADDVPVLTSLGAALVGLRVGQSILWPDRVGGERLLTIVGLRQPPALDFP
jgi:regulator of nucleoside diphosphate kinase